MQPFRAASSSLLVFLAALVAADPATAQFPPTGPPQISIVAPTHLSTRHGLNPQIQVEYAIGGACLDSGDGSCDPNPLTLVVKLNGGANLAQGLDGPNPGWTITEWSATNGSGGVGVDAFNGTVGQTVTNTLYAKICNEYDCAEQTITVYIALEEPEIALGAQHPSLFDPGACAAPLRAMPWSSRTACRATFH
jgi:hypothetical protein